MGQHPRITGVAAVIGVLFCLHSCVHAGWTVSPQLGQKYPLLDSSFNAAVTTAPFSVIFSHSSAQFFPALGTPNTAIFPGSCAGDANNPYGWNRFRSSVLSSASVGFQGDITVLFTPVFGFVLLKPEIVSCGPFVDSDGKALYSGVLPADDQLLTFQIQANINPPLVDLRQMQSDGITLSLYSSRSIQIQESFFRNNGIQIYIVMTYDNWNASRMLDIGNQLVCLPLNLNCLSGIVKPRHFSMWAPNVILLNVPRSEARVFNIYTITTPKPAIWQIQWTLTGLTDTGKSFTTKGLPIQPQVSTTTFQVYPYANPPPRIQLLWKNPPPARQTSGVPPGLSVLEPGILNITEDCLRGKTTVNCPLLIIFSTFQGTTQPQLFSFDGHAWDDTRNYAIRSVQTNFSNYNWVYDLQRVASARPTQMAIVMNPIPQYEIWQTDTLTVLPPFTVFDVLEPPVPDMAEFQIIVNPSIGSVQGITRDITQNEIVNGGLVFEFVMDGESFAPDTVTNFAQFMVGFNKTDAWESMKLSCLFPRGSITYGVTPWGTQNTSRVIVRFAECPDFETLYPDVVTVTLGPQDIRSTMWPIRVLGGMSFRVLKSPGAMTFLNTSTFSQGDFISGNVSFFIKLSSERWPPDLTSLQNCFANLCNFWTSNVPMSVKDNAGWDVSSHRATICATGSFTKLTDRLIRFQSFPDVTYRTRVGERIFVSIPAYCTASGTAPVGNQTMNIKPQSGLVSLQRPDGTIINSLTERDIRNGGFTINIVSQLDAFDDSNSFFLGNTIAAAIVSNGSEALGFNAKKSLVMARPDLNPSNPYQVQLRFQPTPTYDISSDETITITFAASWMASQSLPSPTQLTFTIVSAPGTVAVSDWFGRKPGQCVDSAITEDDVRAGRVWFRFSLLGDQFRRERVPFLTIWSSDISDPLKNGDTFSTNVDALVPDIAFFNFTVDSNSGYDYATFTLQSDFAYDISSRETVKISFTSGTVASKIAPLFDVLANCSGPVLSQSPFWVFQVIPTPGRIVLSGSVANINEKQLRRSQTMFWYLSLVGETWIANISVPLRATLSAFSEVSNPSNESSGFLTYKSALLPDTRISTPLPSVLKLHVAPTSNYQIDLLESINFAVTGALVNSGLTPFSMAPLTVPVTPTGGELTTKQLNFIVSEDFVRSSNFTFSLTLNGDEWNQKAIVEHMDAFLTDGFSSLSPIVYEPNGFLKNKALMLRIGNSPIVTQDFVSAASTVIVYFFPCPSYDVDADETITFTVASAAYVGSAKGYLPDPATVTFTVKAVPQVIVVIVNPNLFYTATYESQPDTFARDVASLLSIPQTRVIASVNVSARRPIDKMLVMLIQFTTQSTQNDPRTSAFLTSTFLALNIDYVYGLIGANYTYLQASPPADEFLYPRGAAVETASSGISTSTQEAIMWSCIGVVTFIVIDVSFYVVMKMQAAKLAVGLLKTEVMESVEGDKFTEKASGELKSRDMETVAAINAFRERERVLGSRGKDIANSESRESSPKEKSRSTNRMADVLGAPVATLSSGLAVVKPMALKDYVRRVELHENPDELTARDIHRRYDDDDEKEQESPDRKQHQQSIRERMDQAEESERRRRTFKDDTQLAKLDPEGKTEAELAELRSRSGATVVQRRRAMVDTLVDF